MLSVDQAGCWAGSMSRAQGSGSSAGHAHQPSSSCPTTACPPALHPPAAEKRKAEAAGGEGEEGEEALRLELEAAEFERAKVGAQQRVVGQAVRGATADFAAHNQGWWHACCPVHAGCAMPYSAHERLSLKHTSR